jgi:predicted small lipoprotein YifL
MRTWIRFALLAALLFLAGCARGPGELPDVQVALAVEPDPPKVGPAKVTVELEGNMAHAGMKPVFAEAKEKKPGVYRAELEFTMGGDWFILVDGKLADGRAFRKKVDVRGVKGR